MDECIGRRMGRSMDERVDRKLPPRKVRSVIEFLNAEGIAPIEIDRQLCQVYGQADVRQLCRACLGINSRVVSGNAHQLRFPIKSVQTASKEFIPRETQPSQLTRYADPRRHRSSSKIQSTVYVTDISLKKTEFEPVKNIKNFHFSQLGQKLSKPLQVHRCGVTRLVVKRVGTGSNPGWDKLPDWGFSGVFSQPIKVELLGSEPKQPIGSKGLHRSPKGEEEEEEEEEDDDDDDDGAIIGQNKRIRQNISSLSTTPVSVETDRTIHDTASTNKRE
ncbi:hypothetical protein ANN_08439 [Periplaneta americana]|uniref:Uncharacterized protein n=1 Tax=Periplaneta americana TaxID=6978 RepID=A0ABQ8T301_PERAM|nr:hypothetical protein ANN_08439 [Periplaneta americana]